MTFQSSDASNKHLDLSVSEEAKNKNNTIYLCLIISVAFSHVPITGRSNLT